MQFLVDGKNRSEMGADKSNDLLSSMRLCCVFCSCGVLKLLLGFAFLVPVLPYIISF